MVTFEWYTLFWGQNSAFPSIYVYYLDWLIRNYHSSENNAQATYCCRLIRSRKKTSQKTAYLHELDIWVWDPPPRWMDLHTPPPRLLYPHAEFGEHGAPLKIVFMFHPRFLIFGIKKCLKSQYEMNITFILVSFQIRC